MSTFAAPSKVKPIVPVPSKAPKVVDGAPNVMVLSAPDWIRSTVAAVSPVLETLAVIVWL